MNQGYHGIRWVTLDRTFQTHLGHSWPPTCTMKKTWMPDLTLWRWSKPSTKFLQLLEMQVKKGFKDFTNLLSH